MTIFQKSLRGILLAALGVLEGLFLPKIKDLTIQNALRANLAPFRPMVVVLTDENPLDGDQLKAVLQEHLNQTVPAWMEGERVRLIEKIQDANIKNVVSALALPGIELIKLVSDSNPDNETQAKEYLAAYFQREDVQDIAFSIVQARIDKMADEVARVMFTEMLKALDEAI
jgi:uncharacterized protein YegL